MSDEIYLEPCPFCGGKPRSDLNKKTHCQLHGDVSQSVRIYCYHECPARPSVSAGDVYNGGINKATVEAANAWNTRADTAAAQVAAAYERAAIYHDYHASKYCRTGNKVDAAAHDQHAKVIRALATDTQADALEQVRKEAERAGYERGVREALDIIGIYNESSDCPYCCDVAAINEKITALLDDPTPDPDEQTEAARELAFRKAVSS